MKNSLTDKETVWFLYQNNVVLSELYDALDKIRLHHYDVASGDIRGAINMLERYSRCLRNGDVPR